MTAVTGNGNGARPVPARVLAVGLGVTNAVAARALVARGHEVVVTDDGERAGAAALADELGCEFHHRPARRELEALLRRSDAFIATPGLPESHAVFELAALIGVRGLSEFDLAAAWDDRPLVAVTGTNGKTTVVTLVASMLEHSGIRCAAVGNLEVPLVGAIEDPDPSCFVVEASSFRLGHSEHFAPSVGTWVNFSPDHLDVHRDLGSYRRAKARIWSEQRTGDTAVFNAQDPVVRAEVVRTTGRGTKVAYALDRRAAQSADAGWEVRYHEHRGSLCGPWGELVAVDDLWSRLPHDRSNVLAAAATAASAGATPEGIRVAATGFGGLPHRVQLVAEVDGVRYYNDSKATTPHAALAATQGFERIVLIAGGRTKGTDLSVLGSATGVRAVVGIGEAAGEVLAALSGVPGVIASDMAEAVRTASSTARPGDVVLLSPACASFDWYGSYVERGDRFVDAVDALVARSQTGDTGGTANTGNTGNTGSAGGTDG